MKIKIAAWTLIGLIALTAFIRFSAKVTTDAILARSEENKTVTASARYDEIRIVRVVEFTKREDAAETETVIEWEPDPNDVAMIAQVIYNEARGCGKTEQAAVAWCVLNRVDADGYGSTIREVVTAPYQFAFTYDTPVTSELYQLAEDVLFRWHDEKNGTENVGRVLPSEYCYFWGDNWHNYFRTTNTAQVYYDWTLPSPYGEG